MQLNFGAVLVNLSRIVSKNESTSRLFLKNFKSTSSNQIKNYQTMSLTNDELKRYSRQLILDEIGKDGQLKLKSSSVLIVGCGGLGCPSSMYLAAAGVG